jgi:glycosyltransferase involved in cell wall biosynthesis
VILTCTLRLVLRRLPASPTAPTIHADPPGVSDAIVLVIPAHNEASRIGPLIGRLLPSVHGRQTRCIVVDDGSTDDTVLEALGAGAKVISHDTNRGLGAAIRTGLAAAVADGCSVVAFCDGDGEYAPEELDRLTAPILSGRADYVVGSRFAGLIRRMHPHRRVGNIVLTHWVRWLTRQAVTDGQSGFRALSRRAAAAADLIHDYNYAQVLTLNLVGQGFGYAEVPISYTFRSSGQSFVRLMPYLRHVVPAVTRELRRQSSTT